MSSSAATTLKNKSLPPKENALFKRILKCYEQKLYKNGLKFAKQILNNSLYSEHAETLAMKGLILNAIGRREEAYSYVRRGLRNDLRSHTCWHVYGLLQRSERKYDEAIKCYRNALKWDPTNIQILRELSIVQIHIRDLRGYRDTRNQLFSLKPAQRASWIGFAMAYHLLHDYKMANRILEDFRKTQPPRDAYDYENSELLLYQNSILEESGAYNEALIHLTINEKLIYDKTTLLETQGRLHFRLNQPTKARAIFEKLVLSNPDNIEYYRDLAKALQIEESASQKLALYKEYECKLPRSNLPRRLPLDCTSGDEFLSYLRPYILSTFAKGVPPLFTDLRSLYSNHEKSLAIENLVLGIVAELEKSIESDTVCPSPNNLSPTKDSPPCSESIPSDSSSGRTTIPQGCTGVQKQSKDSPNAPPASTLLWAYYYLAQHYDYFENTETALTYVNKAIEHTPTLIELFTCKAKILKHAGEFEQAADTMDEARELDTADRYLNSKSAKYHLRANRIETSSTVCGKFTREGSNPVENLNEMQCMWFQTECALAYQRKEEWGESLKKCHEIDRHFNEIIDDQYDFHTYCLRKMTLKSYVQLLRLEDVLRAHPFYFKAAKCAIQVYLHLYDSPLKDTSNDEQATTENLSASELKKLRNKERKAKRKAEMEQRVAAAAAEKKEQHAKSKQSNADDGDYHPPPAEELNSDTLARHPEPLEQAVKFLEPLQSFAFNKIDTHLLAYDIYKRKDKPLLMLRSLKRALKISPRNPTLFEFLVHFRQTMETRLHSLPEPLPQFIGQEIKKLYDLAKLDEWIQELKIN